MVKLTQDCGYFQGGATGGLGSGGGELLVKNCWAMSLRVEAGLRNQLPNCRVAIIRISATKVKINNAWKILTLGTEPSTTLILNCYHCCGFIELSRIWQSPLSPRVVLVKVREWGKCGILEFIYLFIQGSPNKAIYEPGCGRVGLECSRCWRYDGEQNRQRLCALVWLTFY